MSRLLAGLASALRERRLELGLTQEAVAEGAGITPEYVSRIELAKSAPTITVLEAISGPLQTKVSELVRAAEGGSTKTVANSRTKRRARARRIP